MKMVYKEVKEKKVNTRSIIYPIRMNEVEKQMTVLINGNGVNLPEMIRQYIKTVYDTVIQECNTDEDTELYTTEVLQDEDTENVYDTVIQECNTEPLKPVRSEKYKENIKLYTKLIKQLKERAEGSTLYTFDKDPDSNGIKKFVITRLKDNKVMNIWMFEDKPDKFPKGITPIVFNESNFNMDEDYINEWIKG